VQTDKKKKRKTKNTPTRIGKSIATMATTFDMEFVMNQLNKWLMDDLKQDFSKERVLRTQDKSQASSINDKALDAIRALQSIDGSNHKARMKKLNSGAAAIIEEDEEKLEDGEYQQERGKKRIQSLLPSSNILARFRASIAAGAGTFFKCSTAAEGDWVKLNWRDLISELIIASGMCSKGVTEEQVANGVTPLETIEFGAGADGAALHAKQGLLLAMIKIVDKNMLIGLNLLVDESSWKGVQSSLACVVVGFLRGTDDERNNTR
jgi:hypothetical protein